MAASQIARNSSGVERSDFILSQSAGQKKLRVMHVGKFYPPHRGGMETHLKSLCEELKSDIDIEVVVASDRVRSRDEEINGVRVSRLGTLFNFAAAPVCPELVRRIRKADADIVHIHLPNPTAILAYLASGATGRLVITYHSDIIRQKILGSAFLPFMRRALARTSAIIVTSPNYLESSKVLSPFRERCRVIPFGIPVREFENGDQEEARAIRDRYGPRIILGVGRLVYYKGFEYLIRAMAQVNGQLLIVGNGPLLGKLRALIEKCGISDRVALLTDVKDVLPYYHAADIFALSSIARSEAFGIVQLEAMACGLPVINTHLDSGVPFVSPDGVSGITVPPRDSNALAEAINELLDDNERRARYGRAAKNRVRQEFDLSLMTGRTLELYREVMSRNNRS
ncbi:MAG TPA: glycosyltransferase [Pyrinomonadaceae bacterium]|nr:glycosyltransferase [Pyrinomonadaceae bacterium]